MVDKRLTFLISNLDGLFGRISNVATQQQQKVRCIVHYFTRLSQAIPRGMISFERKVLHRQLQGIFPPIPGCDKHYWKNSSSSFCSIRIFDDGLIENQRSNALEVDFANRFLGGGVLRKGCVQEEIRFVISPELIAGMLFMPAMQADEAIEIRGVERFSCHTGYSSSFRFAGDYLDTKQRDSQGRLETRIIAMDALRHPGQRQYEEALLLRETNKAFCGFLNQKLTCLPNQVLTDVSRSPYLELQDHEVAEGNSLHLDENKDHAAFSADITNTRSDNENTTVIKQLHNVHLNSDTFSESEIAMGIATGNWGCGAFGGDVELKSLLQWMAASQAGRPFLHYFTFGSPHGKMLQKVSDIIIKERWLVGDVWKLLVEYGQNRLQRMHKKELFEWILPRLVKGNASKA
ncbi:hypothetical protein GOP47_0017649 [Adiantum capillus-veneris]|uniref:poly(ADP-ribose) glycohydrolase n=1 Tax=Adiantum capillus-veneris TaxID=13818 RepID=A0A9D4ZBZ8_ADICA|nr:hypothetical protein GOP47_0017649 [Adiantum capillus-veneris]